MKTAEDWVNEWSQSGPFDLVASCEEAVELIRAIQTDAGAKVILANGLLTPGKPIIES